MQFHEHLQAFFGSSMEEPEARAIATTVLAENVRSLKLSTARHLWNARQLAGAPDGPGARKSAAHLDAARKLKQLLDSTLEEYASHSDQGDGEAVRSLVDLASHQDPDGSELRSA